MSLKQTIEEIVTKHLPDDAHFVVDVLLNEKGPKQKISILIDADEGLNIDTCATVSRAVGEELEAKDIIDNAYVLEVSSPGLDHPLTGKRQYQKNIGRNLKVTMESGDTLEGKLTAMDQSEITLLVKHKEKGKKAVEKEEKIAFEQIKKSIVLVSFK
ncbi:ribosome maturation factor RimP [Echinicola strongylocentroti]|uniref:Ribosome maturation factor RimP n=1 Tax=Echinicola strongylocentroti TaxID=1795355 RepID=A0A2Z4IQI2_9BACT|nr:ribosome maturation factor RimP [Echinicola strongylocentroti]AWW33125.1 ribosome maturation factor RimP [Echinicola strongylocentroti]